MASLAKAARKLKRTGKSAAQFKFTSTFEYIDLSCNGFWRPDRLKVIWLRNHRRVESISIPWVVAEDRGPNGADGKATFSTPLSVSLIVTLYRAPKETHFEDKEYKYYIESDGPGGKKILASFNCDMAEYAAVPNSKEALDMTFKCVSKKVNRAVLGITLESEFIKEGNSLDDDMQSTFSAISVGQESVIEADEEEEDEDEAAAEASYRLNHSGTAAMNGETPHRSTREVESSVADSVVVLGTGATLKRGTLPTTAPSKPPRTNSFRRHHNIDTDNKEMSEAVATPPDKEVSNTVTTPPDKEVSNNVTTPPDKEVSNTVTTPPDKQQSEPPNEANMADSAVSERAARDSEVEKAKESSDEKDIAKETETKVEKLESSEAQHFEERQGNGGTQHAEERVEPSKHTTTASEEKVTEQSPIPDQINQSDSNSKSESPTRQPNGGEKEQQSLRRDSFNTSKTQHIEDSIFETVQLLAEAHKSRGQDSPPNGHPQRRTIESNETYKVPPNPYLEDEEGEASPPPPVSPTLEWLEEVPIVDCFNETISREKLDNADIIGLYFSASWCPPCRRFLPKLIYFYHQLKQHNKSFEVIYLSSDYSKPDMLKYMVEQQMPWVAMEHGSQIVETLKAKFKVKAIPLLTIVSTKGEKIEESAKKAVEGANTASAAVKLYNKWHKLIAPEGGMENSDPHGGAVDSEGKEKKGILSRVKSHIKGKGKNESVEEEGDSSSQKTAEAPVEGERQAVEERVRSKSKKSKSTSSEHLEERDERIRHLEAVNVTLKQTNDDLNEEVSELRKQLNEQAEKIRLLESTHQRLEDERRTLAANMNIRGWLYKRGAKGPTANVWRRRYFRCDQGSRICYYKTSNEGTPQGFIDLDKVISVQEVSAAQQDKNHATFLVQCDGRTYQLQAHDEATMRKWMSAIEYLKTYRQSGGAAAIRESEQ